VIAPSPHPHVVAQLMALALAPLLFAGCTHAPPSAAYAQKVDALLALVRGNLELAARDARTAWLARKTIDDSSAQSELVDFAINRAQDYALPPEMVRDFLQAQFEAARHVRASLNTLWDAQPASLPAPAADERSAVREGPTQAIATLLAALAQAYPALRQPGSRDFLEQRADVLLNGAPGGAYAATLAIAPLWRSAK
jgi:hypothetical protein